MTIDRYQLIRRLSLGATGAVALIYAFGIIVTQSPEPFSAWIPTLAGLSCAVLLFGLAFTVGRGHGEALMDELTRATFARSYAWGYWIAVAMFYATWFLSSNDILPLRDAVIFSAMIVAGAPLVIFTWLDWRQG